MHPFTLIWWQQKKGVPIPKQKDDGGQTTVSECHMTAMKNTALKNSNLPAWLVSALKLVSGRDVEVYNSLQSLECKRSTLPKASQLTASIYQMPSNWCANSMTKGETHIHNTNCTVVAVDDHLGVVYMTCVTGAPGHKITEISDVGVKIVNMHSVLQDNKVQPVREVKGRCIHWAMFDEEDMNLLIKKGYCQSMFKRC